MTIDNFKGEYRWLSNFHMVDVEWQGHIFPSNLVEGNSWNDVWWGVCEGEGENHLGRILMDIRAEIIESTST